MKFNSIVPILYSSDVSESISYFVNKLGFQHQWEWDNPPTFGGVSRDKTELFFCKDGQGHPGTWLSIFVDDIDAYFKLLEKNGAIILSPPETMEWGVREMLVEAPDGHRLRFGQNTSELPVPVNKLTTLVRNLDFTGLNRLLDEEPHWLQWAETDGKNALHLLCSLDVKGKPAKATASLRILQLLVGRGMDINAVHQIPDHGTTFPATPLWHAYAKGKNKKLYTWLLQNGANPDNCMFAIAWQNDIKAAGLFYHHGASLTDANGRHTPFLGAVNWGNLRIAKWFLEHGADVNTADDHGDTALHYAVRKGYNPAFIKHLIKAGANPALANSEGATPLGLARETNHKNLISVLGSSNQ